MDQKCHQLRHRTSRANGFVDRTNSLAVRMADSDPQGNAGNLRFRPLPYYAPGAIAGNVIKVTVSGKMDNLEHLPGKGYRLKTGRA